MRSTRTAHFTRLALALAATALAGTTTAQTAEPAAAAQTATPEKAPDKAPDQAPAVPDAAPAPGLQLPELRDLSVAVPRPVRAASAMLGMGRQRLALVLGLATVGSRPVVDNAPRDVQAVAAVLREAGFVVMVREDLLAADLRTTLKEFSTRLQPGGIGFVYAAGLGAQLDGQNVLLPRDAALDAATPAAERQAQWRDKAVPVAELVNALLGPAGSPRLLVVDAAYQHPALAGLPAKGLGDQRLPPGVMALFSAAPGTVQEVPAVAALPSPPPTRPQELAASRFARTLVGQLAAPRAKGPDALRATRRALVDGSLGQIEPWVGGDTDSEEVAEATLLDGVVPRTPEDLAREAARQVARTMSRSTAAAATTTATTTTSAVGTAGSAATTVATTTVPAAPGMASAAGAAGEQSVTEVLEQAEKAKPNAMRKPQPESAPAQGNPSASPSAGTPGTPSLGSVASAAASTASTAAATSGAGSALGSAASAAGTVASVAGTAASVAGTVATAAVVAKAVETAVVASAATTALSTAGSLASSAFTLATRGAAAAEKPAAAAAAATATAAANAANSSPAPAAAKALATAAAVATAPATPVTTAPATPAGTAARAATSSAAPAATPKASPTPASAVAEPVAAEALNVAATVARPGDWPVEAINAAAPVRPPAAAQAPRAAQAPAAAAAALPRVNPFGYSAGDVFTYRVTDTWKGQVKGNTSTAIDAVAEDGGLLGTANGQPLRLDPEGRVLSQGNADGTVSTFEPRQDLWWSNPKRGESRDLRFKETLQRSDGSYPGQRGEVDWKGSASVGRAAKVRTAAGEFEALPIESSGWQYALRSDGTRADSKWSRTVWYSPKLGHPVAIDIEDTDHLGRLLKRERLELLRVQSARQPQ